MKLGRSFLLMALVLALCPIVAAAQDFDAGMRAYKQSDYEGVLKELRTLADQGDADAQFNLGVMYDEGIGVPQDAAEAVKWFRLAAEQQGLARAQFNLGVMYDEGIGVPQDYVLAHMWLNVAAANGHENARKGRELVAARMSVEAISTAQSLARTCLKTYYADCG